MPDPLTPNALRAALAALIGDEAAGRDRLGIAVSGGPDSMALLDLAHAFAPDRVEAATVDHGLRPEAAYEAAMVAGWCAATGIPHTTLHPDAPIRGSVQAEARAVRYALLERWMDGRGIDWLLTAHHADDQLETLVMRLNRGSGVAGLAGIRAQRGRVLRPLLGIRRSALAAHVAARDIPHVLDPSNVDARYDRARLRGSLAGADWLNPEAAARSAAALADAEAALNWSAGQLYAGRVSERDGALILDPEGLPSEYRLRLVRMMVHALSPDGPEPRGEQIVQAIVQLCHGNRISIGACVAEGGMVWTVRRAPPRRHP